MNSFKTLQPFLKTLNVFCDRKTSPQVPRTLSVSLLINRSQNRFYNVYIYIYNNITMYVTYLQSHLIYVYCILYML